MPILDLATKFSGLDMNAYNAEDGPGDPDAATAVRDPSASEKWNEWYLVRTDPDWHVITPKEQERARRHTKPETPLREDWIVCDVGEDGETVTFEVVEENKEPVPSLVAAHVQEKPDSPPKIHQEQIAQASEAEKDAPLPLDNEQPPSTRSHETLRPTTPCTMAETPATPSAPRKNHHTNKFIPLPLPPPQLPLFRTSTRTTRSLPANPVNAQAGRLDEKDLLFPTLAYQAQLQSVRHSPHTPAKRSEILSQLGNTNTTVEAQSQQIRHSAAAAVATRYAADRSEEMLASLERRYPGWLGVPY